MYCNDQPTNRQTVVLENIDIDVHTYDCFCGRGHWILPLTNSSRLKKKKRRNRIHQLDISRILLQEFSGFIRFCVHLEVIFIVKSLCVCAGGGPVCKNYISVSVQAMT